jgi:hypothetical protein
MGPIMHEDSGEKKEEEKKSWCDKDRRETWGGCY